MKISISFIVLFSALLFTGCFGKGTNSTTKTEDFFAKKKECSQLFDGHSKRLADENSDRIKTLNFSNKGKSQRFSVRFLESVCFSTERNTCVGFISSSYRDLPRVGKYVEIGIGEIVVDLLTNEQIYSATHLIGDQGGEETFNKVRDLNRELIMCAK